MIPDDEPWWMVRANTDNGLPTAAAIGDRYMADKVCHGTCPLAAERQQANPADTLQALESLDFRPIGYEW
jgi:hypothetical protein